MDTSLSICHQLGIETLRGNFVEISSILIGETMTSIRRGNFNMDSIFKIDEISISFPRGFFYTVSMSNRRNFFTR